MDLSRFGAVEQDWHMHLRMSAGLLGFPKVKEYFIVDPEPALPVKWLQACHELPLAFVITDPFALLPNYQVELSHLDLLDVGACATTDLFLVAIVTLHCASAASPTVNLQGPVLINRANGWAKQLVLVQGTYHTHHPLTLVPPLDPYTEEGRSPSPATTGLPGRQA
jgi:flagellar assembly factor FliW